MWTADTVTLDFSWEQVEVPTVGDFEFAQIATASRRRHKVTEGKSPSLSDSKVAIVIEMFVVYMS